MHGVDSAPAALLTFLRVKRTLTPPREPSAEPAREPAEEVDTALLETDGSTSNLLPEGWSNLVRGGGWSNLVAGREKEEGLLLEACREGTGGRRRGRC